MEKMYDNKLGTVLKQALVANKKISRIPELEKMSEEFPTQLRLLNSLERNATALGKLQLCDIPFPECLKSMVYPNSVTVNGKAQDADFLLRRTLPEGDVAPWTRAQWMDFCTLLYASQRMEAKVVSVADLRKDEILANVAEISAVDHGDGEVAQFWCGFTCEDRFPIPLVMSVKREAFYSQSVIEMADEHIFRNLLKLKADK